MKEMHGNILIMSDFDGTYYGVGRRVPENDDAVRRFIANGGYFTFASGRPAYDLERLLPDCAGFCNVPVAGLNAACMHDMQTHTDIDVSYLDTAAILEVLDYANDNYEGVNSIFFGVDRSFSDPGDKRISGISTNTVIAPMREWKCVKWPKMIFIGEPELIVELKRDLVEVFGEKFEFSRSTPRILEVQNKGMTKARAVKWMREYMRKRGVDVKIIAAGDNENDIDMLMAADVAVCPSNAIDSVKEICSYCLCHCDDGFMAKLIAELESGAIKI